MWLKMDLDGIILSLQIRDYVKTSHDDWDSRWCKVDFSLVSKPETWLNYRITNDETLLASEIDDLSRALERLLKDRLTSPIEFNCIEPDFHFMLNPKKDLRDDPKYTYVRPGYEIVDIDMEWKTSFWDGGLTENYLSVRLYREEIEQLLLYLQLISGTRSVGDPAIGQLIQKKIIC